MDEFPGPQKRGTGGTRTELIIEGQKERCTRTELIIERQKDRCRTFDFPFPFDKLRVRVAQDDSSWGIFRTLNPSSLWPEPRWVRVRQQERWICFRLGSRQAYSLQ